MNQIGLPASMNHVWKEMMRLQQLGENKENL